MSRGGVECPYELIITCGIALEVSLGQSTMASGAEEEIFPLER